MPIRLSCVFEPDQGAVLYTPEDGRVTEVLFAEGQRVEAGQSLLRLQARELSADRAQETLDQQDERASQLTLSAPAAGFCLTPRPEELLGQAVTRGALMLTIGDASRLVAVVRVDPDKSWNLREGAPVLVQPRSLPGTTLQGRTRSIVPAGGETAAFLRSGPDPGTHAVGDEPWRPALSSGDSSLGERSEGLRLSVPVINPGALRPGMSGSVKVYGPARSLLGHLRDAALRLIRADLWG